MAMVPLLSMLFFLLLTCFSFNTLHSFASQLSYKDHCASVVPESTPREYIFKTFPLGLDQTVYCTGGDRILGVNNPSWQRRSLFLRTRYLRATDVTGQFKIKAYIVIRSTSPYYYAGNFSYSNSSYRSPVSYRSATIWLRGFWSKSTGKLCMVGSGDGYSKGGNSLHLDTVLKLNNVFNSSNITSLVSGSLESLSSENQENYFEPISVLMLPLLNYKYTLDFKEANNESSPAGSDDSEQGLSESSFSFCSSRVSRAIKELHLEYSSNCNSLQNCTPFSRINTGYLPSFMSLKEIECTLTEKHQLRVLVRFHNHSNKGFYQAFNPTTMLVGEGWWDEKKNRLCVVACHFLGLTSSSFTSAHVGDCSVRLRLTFSSVWSIKKTSIVVGKIWSNKTAEDEGYFKRITFRKDDDLKVGVQGLKYEYTQLDRVKNLCPRLNKTVSNRGKSYPNPYSYNMKFDMWVREAYRRVAWGYSAPLFVGDQFYGLESFAISDSAFSPSSSIAVPAENFSNSGLFNISYKIGASLLHNGYASLGDRNSLFNMSFKEVKISAEGIYDERTGSLCMVGCRNLPSNNGIPMALSVDCDVLVKFQFPPLHASKVSNIEGFIESTRNKSDPLHFKRLDITSAAYYKEAATETVQRKDMEIIMVLISTTLSCVFVGFQLYHVKRHPDVLPFISLIMMTILTLNHMIPLVLNFEAIFTKNLNSQNFVLGDVAWLESNEIIVRLITMVAFLLQFRLLQLTYSARKIYGTQNKGLRVAEKEALYVTLPLYATGFLVAIMVKWKKNHGDGVQGSDIGYSGYQQSSSWEVLKSYGGLILDSFLLPQIMLNLFSNLRENALSCSFYFGTTFVRLLPHAYDLYRNHNYVRQYDKSYFYADPSADFYFTAWDIAIPLGGLLFAVIIYLQQRFGGSCILPCRFKGSEAYEKVPVVTETEAEEEAT